MLGIFNSPIGQTIAPHISAKRLANMIEEYMGFEKYDFIKDNAQLFEGAEMEKLKMQVQQDLQTQQMQPSLEQDMMDDRIEQLEGQIPQA